MNNDMGIRTDRVLRTIMFASAAAGTDMPFALWIAPASAAQRHVF